MKNNGFCTVMLLWDESSVCFCNIQPNEKQCFLQGDAVVGSIMLLFLQGNAVVGSITSLLLQHQT